MTDFKERLKDYSEFCTARHSEQGGELVERAIERIEDLELELKRSKEISKRQGEITAINMEDFIELTDELKKANARIEELESELQGARRVISQIPDTL